jgi:TrmH family RNA methyltransferase
MGAHFNISIIQSTWVDISLLFKSLNISIYLADSTKGQPYDQYKFSSPLAIIIGGEASGVGVEAQNLSPNRVKIPMVEGVDSLNAACAAAILIFEVLRQRRHINP